MLAVGVGVFFLVAAGVLTVVILNAARKPAPLTPPTAAAIAQAQATYLQTEGHANRGPAFGELAFLLNQQAMAGKVFTEAQLIAVLGPPDRLGRYATQTNLIYYFDRQAKKDWVVYIDVTATGTAFGYNNATVNAAADAAVPPYSATTLPTSVPYPRRGRGQ